MALLGKRVLLVDLDTLSPSLAISLGLVDTPAGLSACLRLADQSRLTSDEYHRLTVTIQLGRQELRFMPGLNSPSRWTEVTVDRFIRLLESIKSEIDIVVVDLPQATQFRAHLHHPSAMAQNLDLGRDTFLIDFLKHCSKLVLVSGCDPVSAHRFLAAMEYLEEFDTQVNPYTVVNRFRTTSIGSNAKTELEQAFLSLAKVRIDSFIPDEPQNLDRALLNGLPLTLLKRSSPARQAIGDLARQLLLDSASGEALAKLS
jgi:MinD-like ATPase involved in chromosome partitioning or flagellar assembly